MVTQGTVLNHKLPLSTTFKGGTTVFLNIMAFAPAVQITHLDHQSPFDVTKLSSTLKISSPVVLVSSAEEDVFLN